MMHSGDLQIESNIILKTSFNGILPSRKNNVKVNLEMKLNFDFFKTTMPNSRKADFYLGCLDSSVYIDFNLSDDNQVYLRRISFDGYGCCNLGDDVKYLNHKDSQRFTEEIKKENLNQKVITELVKKIIKLNKEFIWIDALEKYGLLERE